MAAVDPLNLVGILSPGAKVPAHGGATILYRDGAFEAVEDRGGGLRRTA